MPYKGSRRKKKHTHKTPGPGAEKDKTPACIVLRRGDVARPVRELVQGLRELMKPFTAPRLRERRSNTLKDFVDVAGPLGISHMMLLSQTSANTLLRLCRLPHGPTLTFRLETYALARHVRAAQRHPVDMPTAFEQPPLVVLHGFGGAGAGGAGAAAAAVAGAAGVSLADALKMTTAMLHGVFPQLQPAKVRVSSCRRVALFHYDAARGVIEFRHYFVRSVPVGLSRAVRKVAAGLPGGGGKLPDLGRLADVSEFMLGAGAGESDSEAEPDAAARVPAGLAAAAPLRRGRRAPAAAATQSAIKLSEIGPRLTLRLIKIEQGLTAGAVLYHAFETRTVAQAAELQRAAEERERARAARIALQAANVARKEGERAAAKAAKLARIAARQDAAKRAAAEGRLADDADGIDAVAGDDGGGDGDDDAAGDEEEEEEEEGEEEEEEEGAGFEGEEEEETGDVFDDDDGGDVFDDGDEEAVEDEEAEEEAYVDARRHAKGSSSATAAAAAPAAAASPPAPKRVRFQHAPSGPSGRAPTGGRGAAAGTPHAKRQRR